MKINPPKPSYIAQGDALKIPLPDQSVDLVLCSPPYEDARTYDIGFNLKGEAYVSWAVAGILEHLRICRGLVAWVIEGRTKQYAYTMTPILIMADLHRAGETLRKPPIYKRNGIPGSGGPDWLRNDYEPIICATNGGRLPWSNNTACGHPPKYGAGGGATHRNAKGKRKAGAAYALPKLANPGNVIDCGASGGGNIGSKLAHENEAPYPEKLAEFFIKSFCPPGGIVCDPFSGSGTTVSVAERLGRTGVGFDVRESQVELSRRRLALVRESFTPCEFCAEPFDQDRYGRFGCVNCHGEGVQVG